MNQATLWILVVLCGVLGAVLLVVALDKKVDTGDKTHIKKHKKVSVAVGVVLLAVALLLLVLHFLSHKKVKGLSKRNSLHTANL